MSGEEAREILQQIRKQKCVNECDYSCPLYESKTFCLEERALDLAIKALEQQPCEDCISREAVNVLVDELARAISDERCCISRGRSTATIMRDILHLPSVKPKYTDEEIDRAQAVEQAYVDKMVELAVEGAKRPKGKWIKVDDEEPIAYDCSECNAMVTKKYNYCPNCGSYNGGGEDEDGKSL